MTRREREYLTKLVFDNQQTADDVQNEWQWADIFKTPEQKLAFVQGITHVNQVLAAFLNISDYQLKQQRRMM